MKRALALLLLALPAASQEPPSPSVLRPGLLAGYGGQDAPQATPESIVNGYFEAKWKDAKVKPGPSADPYAFYRRIALDLTGRLPDPDDVRRDARSKDRTKLIDETLASPAAAEFFADMWIQWLTGHEVGFQDQLRCEFEALHDWLRSAWTTDMPYDQFVRTLLSDRGMPKERPAVNYGLKHVVAGEPPVALVTQTARLFLAKDIRCAQCHDHPFEKMSQEEFWGFAAFFRPIHRAQNGGLAEGDLVLEGKAREDLGEMFEKPAFFDGRKPEAGRRLGEQLADFLLTTKDQEHARAIVDRHWKHFFGRGFGKAHAPLHHALVRDFMGNRQSVRRLVRGILMSKPYQLASEGKSDDRVAYAAGPLKYMNPVQFFRAQERAFSLREHYWKLYEKARTDPQTAAVYRDPQNIWLAFYRWAKEMVFPKGRDPEEAIASGTVRLSLKFMNNRDLQILIFAQFGIVRKIMKDKSSPEARVEELFYTLVGRPPSKDEKSRVVDYVKGISNPYHGMEDVFWMLVNSAEFIFIR